MRRLVASLVLVHVLAGCASGISWSTQTKLLASCGEFTDTEKALRPFKPQMSDDQVRAMNVAIDTAEPICTGDVDVSTDDLARSALDLVRAKLAALVAVQNEVKK